MFIIDHDRMRRMTAMPPRPATAMDLFREGRAFFVGGALPIQETLETMFESHCEASTDLFVVTFGGAGTMGRGLEMVRSLKKNFNMRLLASIDNPISDSLYGQIYAAGADLLEIPVTSTPGERLTAAVAAFPRWAVAATVSVGGASAACEKRVIGDLLNDGVVPLPRLPGQGASEEESDNPCDVLRYLIESWHSHKACIRPFAAVITHHSPLIPSQKPGTLRTLFDRLHERRQVVASDLLRHLRVGSPTDSLDSAGL